MVNEKIQQAVEILKELNVDMWLVFARETSTTPDPMLELVLGTHCTWTSAFIITASGERIALVGSLDVQNIKDHADYKVMGYVDSIKSSLIKVLDEQQPEKIAVNYSQNDVMADGLSHGLYLTLGEYLKDTPYWERIETSEKIVAALRGRKSETEVERIKAAIAETLDIFNDVTEYVKPGMTEEQVAAFIRSRVRERHLQLAWDPTHCPAVFTGPDTAGAHAGPTARKIKPGHIMNIDFGVRKNGYVSDLQRTWFFPQDDEIPDAVLHGFNTIYESIQAAARALKPGMLGWEVDAVARNYIKQAGYEEFPHALGHQVGRQAHDGSALLCPQWDRYKDMPFSKVEAGQVYTIEPRLTVEGYGIATIEEIVVVHENGCEFLSTPQTELWVIR